MIDKTEAVLFLTFNELVNKRNYLQSVNIKLKDSAELNVESIQSSMGLDK